MAPLVPATPFFKELTTPAPTFFAVVVLVAAALGGGGLSPGAVAGLFLTTVEVLPSLVSEVPLTLLVVAVLVPGLDTAAGMGWPPTVAPRFLADGGGFAAEMALEDGIFLTEPGRIVGRGAVFRTTLWRREAVALVPFVGETGPAMGRAMPVPVRLAPGVMTGFGLRCGTARMLEEVGDKMCWLVE